MANYLERGVQAKYGLTITMQPGDRFTVSPTGLWLVNRWGPSEGWGDESVGYPVYFRMAGGAVIYILDNGHTIEVWKGARYGTYYEEPNETAVLLECIGKKTPRDGHGVSIELQFKGGLLKSKSLKKRVH
jgi:hypothetical protein